MNKNTTIELLSAIKQFDKNVFKATNGFVVDYEMYGILLDFILEPTPHRYDNVIEHLKTIFKEFDKDEKIALIDDYWLLDKSLRNMIVSES